ncbi:hypothetical protein V5799_023196 [Amblyomma americanum]|uniref:Uncharacterized protein n=1 Tax=Amblyomma americanum TaxID=6943 RepID=A0AAQ4FIH3_AMBAM
MYENGKRSCDDQWRAFNSRVSLPRFRVTLRRLALAEVRHLLRLRGWLIAGWGENIQTRKVPTAPLLWRG